MCVYVCMYVLVIVCVWIYICICILYIKHIHMKNIDHTCVYLYYSYIRELPGYIQYLIYRL